MSHLRVELGGVGCLSHLNILDYRKIIAIHVTGKQKLTPPMLYVQCIATKIWNYIKLGKINDAHPKTRPLLYRGRFIQK